MRSIWTGAISFGLVNIPIKLYSASEDQSLSFHYLHDKDHSPIRYAKICRKEEKEVPYSQIVRGYEYQKGSFVVLEDEDFKRANPRKTRTIEIRQFVEATDIDLMYFEKPYYLEPDRGADKAYALLREALRDSKKVGVATFVLRNRENLALVQASDKVLVLEQLRFADEIRKPNELKVPEVDHTNKKELEIAKALIDQLTAPFDPDQFQDTYTHELETVIQAKMEGKVIHLPQAERPAAKVTDLMSLLKASLKKPTKGRSKKAA